MSKIAVIGLVGESVFLRVERHQAVGETARAESIHRELGGKGYNQAVAAARYGSKVAFLCAVCKDDAAAVRATGEREGIAMYVAGKSTPSPYGVIVTDSTGDNRVTVYGGAELEESDVAAFRSEIESADILLINNEVPEEVNVAAAKIARAAGKRIILNPAPVRNICDYLLRNIDIFTPNEHEAYALSDRDNLIITLGGAGSYVKWCDTTVPAFDVGDVVDTTGAGDTFSGVLTACLGDGVCVECAARVASAAAALEVGRRYVMPSIPRREEIEELLDKKS